MSEKHPSRWIGRRTALQAGLSGLTVLAAPTVATHAADEKTVIFAGWGGNDQDNIREIFFKTFEKETGIRVIDTTLSSDGLAQIKTMVSSRNVQWDVVHDLGMWIPLGDKIGVWEKLDYSIIDRKGVPDAMVTPTSIGFITNGIVMCYNTNEFPQGHQPQSWPEFWNVSAFPGARGLQDAPRYTLEFALLADGVAPAKLYPLDVDRAFRSLDKIRPRIHIWWKQWPQVPILLASGELAATYMSDARILTAKQKEKAPVDFTWNQGLLTVDPLSVPKGAPHRENAMKLINWLIKPALQAEGATRAGFGPSNQLAAQTLSERTRRQLPGYYFQNGELTKFSDAWWAENNDEMLKRWTQWRLS